MRMKNRFGSILRRFVPILAWLARYRGSWASFAAYGLTLYILLGIGESIHHPGTVTVISFILLGLLFAGISAYQAYDDPAVRLPFDPGTPEDDERLVAARRHAAKVKFWSCFPLGGITLGLILALIVSVHLPW